MDGKRLALIVATDTYEDPALSQLVSPAQDADALSGVLGDPGIGDFEVRTLHNPSSYEVCQEVETLLRDRSPADLVLLHFSCHGIKDDNGELYLAAANTRTSLLASTAVDSSLIDRLIQRTRARRVVLLLDCCYGGAFERGLRSRSTATVGVAEQFAAVTASPPGQGRVVITASDAMEYAFEGTDVTQLSQSGPSLFTGALVEGLATGEADRDRDGEVSLGELYDYVYDHVRQRAPSQTPKKWEFGLQGDVHIARNPRPSVVPGALPTELLELAGSHLAGSRLAAALELAQVAAGKELPVAAAARRQLLHLSEDDSRKVAAAAAEALASTAISIEPAVVHLEACSAGAPSNDAVVRVGGPPLARVFSLTSSSPHVEAMRAPDGGHIVVRLSRDAPAEVDAIVHVTSSAGELALPVTTTASPSRPTPVSAPAPVDVSAPAPPSTPAPTAVQGRTERRPDHQQADPAATPLQAITRTPATAGSGRLWWSVLWTALPVVSVGLLAFVPPLHAALKLRDATSAVVGALVLVLIVLSPPEMLLVAAALGLWQAVRTRRQVFALAPPGGGGSGQ